MWAEGRDTVAFAAIVPASVYRALLSGPRKGSQPPPSAIFEMCMGITGL